MVHQYVALLNSVSTLGANGHHSVPPIVCHPEDSAKHGSHGSYGFACPISDTVQHGLIRAGKLDNQ